jgi:osmoprotectant transport system permease protein
MSFIIANPSLVMVLLAQHLSVVAVAMVISIALALPAGVLIARHKRFSAWVLGALGVIYTIPSIALIILLIPVLGLGQQAVIAALILYSQVILMRNLVTGLRGISPAVLEAADGMGMNRRPAVDPGRAAAVSADLACWNQDRGRRLDRDCHDRGKIWGRRVGRSPV